MPNWVWGVAFLVAYVVLTQWLLPNSEFPPEGAKVAPSLGAKPRVTPITEPEVTLDYPLHRRHEEEFADRFSRNIDRVRSTCDFCYHASPGNS